MGALALSTADLRKISGEPRVHDLRLGEVLGFDRPRNVRKIIRRNSQELALHGALALHGGASISGKGRVMPSEEFYLNEAQALLICMFSRTNEAASARKQIVEAFLAYRHGKLVPIAAGEVPTYDHDRPWAKMEQRLKRLERLMEVQAKIETSAFASALAYSPTVLRLTDAKGRRKRQTRPRWWYDREVREAVIAAHRQMTIDIAVASLRQQFGRDRAPSRSSVGRFWQTLDEVRAAQ